MFAEEIAGLNTQAVNTKAVIDNINALLRDSGFQGFSLCEKAVTKRRSKRTLTME